MNQILSLIPLLALLALIPAIYGAYIKLSARLLRHQGITWKQGFVFGLIVVICSLLGRASALLIGYSMPLVLAVVLGLLINLIIGGWFFRGRGTNADGRALGWGGAMKLTGLALCHAGRHGSSIDRSSEDAYRPDDVITNASSRLANSFGCALRALNFNGASC